MTRNKNVSKSRLCNYSPLDYIFLASTLALALGEELSSNDINVLATFFAVLSDELALIASIEACNSNGEDDVFVPPVPDVALTKNNSRKRVYKRKVKKKKNT